MIFRTGDKLLRDLFVLDSDLTEFEHAVHLIRDRNLFGEAAGGHMSKSHLRDTKYGLFTRPELAVPVGTTTVRQGGGMVQSKAATGSAAHGSSFENSSDEDDGEDSSSSSGEDDDDSSSSEDEDSLVTMKNGFFFFFFFLKNVFFSRRIVSMLSVEARSAFLFLCCILLLQLGAQ